LNKREKEEYLRDYGILKSQGKPFFPYAVAKDGAMAVVVMIVIITMSIVLGAELGPKADPTTTTYTPRPEWYFYFLFEVLRIIKPAYLVPLATIGIPTICMILLFLLPFYDRGAERRPERRPIATTAGIFTIAAMGYLTFLGAEAGPPTQIDMPTPARIVAAGGPMLKQYELGKQVAAQSGCEACHKFGSNAPAQAGDRADAGQPDGPDAVVQEPAAREVQRARHLPLAAEVAAMGTGPRAGTLEEPQVRAMFDRIAGVYDVMNSVMTAGMHHRWRRRAADLAELTPGDEALDVATGTGDLAVELASRGAHVTASDFSEEMLARARSKDPGLRWEWANAQDLPYETDRFAAATVGFGARNFSDLALGLSEMARVVRPGGKVVILEITTPQKPPLSTFFSLWFDRVVPAIGKLAGDTDAYTYLPNSVKRFPGPEGLAAVMAGAGLRDIRWILTAGGIIAIHVGTK
jgi:demethylmenaquinone methyltransferase/2-methoxy-6-polyprenyl-1,4-benzoquinol methylase